jgi:hypothetical protein
MAEDAVETARAHLVRVVAQTSIGDPAWTIGPAAAELIVMRLEALMDAKAAASRGTQFAGELHMEAGTLMDANRVPTHIVKLDNGAALALPEGFFRAETVEGRGQLPNGFRHDTYVEVVHRDGIVNKPLKVGMRPSVGEAAIFNWKQTGSDDDIIGYKFVEPPENKMAVPKKVA